ncbi:hypothetical protein SEA_KROMP_23 [Streptomyces phage Kromp]|uniref:Uncharacterized protein n=1 Tax=Streptomyces phage Kromp TaxID=2315619 RepID=A0A386KBC7_9CAUD|nr:hypothetical protein SEA_KROMP_23 [Streptomyces phage Kromp]
MSSSQKPSVGRIVHVPMPPAANNGSDTAAAVITRAFDEETINVRILADSTASPQEWRTSLTYVDELAYDPDDTTSLYRWTWPPRA